jgi:hypothetical protein
MTGAEKIVCQAATLLLLLTLTSVPAKAQFQGLSGGGGRGELMGMIPQLMRMANFGGGGHRRHRRR